MNIAMLGPFGLRPKSTVRRRALPLGKALAARGHRVRVIVPPWDWPADAGREWREDSVQVQCLTLSPSAPGLSSAALLVRLVRGALEVQPDVIHCFKPKAYAGLAAFLLWYARGLGVWQGRLVVDSDDWEGPGGWNERGGYSWTQRHFFAWQERWGLRHADAVTVASHALQTLAWSLGVPPQRVHYLPNGVSPRALTQGKGEGVGRGCGMEGRPVVLCYTRFVGCGPSRWARIVAEVADRVPLAHFLVVGVGLAGEEREFQDRIQAQGLAERVTPAGWVPEEDLPRYFAADLALFPLDDTLVNRARCPAKLADLLAAGVPVLAEAVGEAKKYIEDGVSGVLLPPGSPPGRWGVEAAALLDNDARRRRLGMTARREMEKFTWGQLVEGLLTFYPRVKASE
ncbi:MAG: glycosyltransferase family 4 protein [Chloroflexota bacterium]|nr:glycosyltransferase family 4 protein [Chloroflexota bacterium]